MIAATSDFGGGVYTNDLILADDFRITGFFLSIQTVRMDDPGPELIQAIKDLQFIEQTMGLNETYSFELAYIESQVIESLDYEIFTMLGFAIVTVTIVVMLITFDLKMTVIVICLVSLVIIYMVGICKVWGLTLNHILVINLAFGLGIAID